MPDKSIQKVKKKAHSMTMNKWTAIIAEEMDLKVAGNSPTERMWYLIG